MQSPATTRPTAARATASITLGMVLLATLVTLGAGLAFKAPCASAAWGDGRQYRRLCYSDIIPLYGTEYLQGGRLPYLDACPTRSEQCDEYPVLTMYFMRTAAWIGHGYEGYFYVTVLGLSIAALVIAWALFRLVGRWALMFALAPTLMIYGFVNWDLLAAALAVLGVLAFARGRDGWSGILLGLGAATKLFPALLVIPLALHRWRQGRRQDAGLLAMAAAGAFAAVNIPFVLLAPHQWATFFRFNAARPIDWDSLWYVACQRQHWGCSLSPKTVDLLSLALLALLAMVVWALRQAREPDFPAWTFGFPLLVLFLLTSKVYSPQYGIWLLPWFALAMRNLPLFIVFELADVAVFLTRFPWFGRWAADSGDPIFHGYHGVPLGAYQLALGVRAAVLIACLVAWILGERGRHALGPEGTGGLMARPEPLRLEAPA